MKNHTRHRLLRQLIAVIGLGAVIVVWISMDSRQQTDHPKWLQVDFRRASDAQHWDVSQNWRTRGLTLRTGGRAAGLAFEARTTSAWQNADDIAISNWAIGDESFHFCATAVVEHGMLQKYFEAGVAVVLCGRPPDEMGNDDLSVVLHINYAGVGMAVWKGWFLSPSAEQVSETTHDVDGLESVPWHMQFLTDTRLRLTVDRTGNQLRFVVDSSSVPALRPWHTESYIIPPDQTLNIRHIIVQRVPVKPSHVGYPDFQLRGRLTELVGYPQDHPPPEITHGQLNLADRIRLFGSNLDGIESARMASLPEQQTAQADAAMLELSGTDKTFPERSVPVTLRKGSQVWRSAIRNESVTWIDSISPREASASGDVLTLRGSRLGGIRSLSIAHNKLTILSQSHDLLTARLSPLPPGRYPVVATGHNGKNVACPDILVGRHPQLLWTNEQRKKYHTQFQSTDFAPWRTAIRENARAGNLLALLLITTLADDKPARQDLLEKVRTICRERKAIEFDALTWGAVALIYDSLFDSLGPADRDEMRAYLEFTLECYRKSDADWFFRTIENPSNTVAISNAGGGLVALALFDTHRHAPMLARRARTRLRDFATVTIRPDGGYIEGALYWNFAMSEYAKFIHAWRQSSAAPQRSDIAPAIARMPQYADAVLGGDGRVLTFNDAQPEFTGMPVIAFLGNEFNLPHLTQFVDHNIAEQRANQPALAFLLRSTAAFNAEHPQLPLRTVLPETALATLRSSTAPREGGVLSIFGATSQMSHHKQFDQGSLIYSFNGENLLIDPGYFQSKANCHSIPLIDGKGPQAGIPTKFLQSATDGSTHYLSLDLSAAYQSAPEDLPPASVVRNILFHNGEFVVVDAISRVNQDDIFQLEQQLQTSVAPTEAGLQSAGGVSFGLGSDDRVVVRFEGQDWKSQTEGPRQFGKSWIFNRLQEQGEISWYSTRLKAQRNGRRPAVWSLSTSGQPIELSCGSDRIRGSFSDGKPFLMTRRPDGWTWIRD